MAIWDGLFSRDKSKENLSLKDSFSALQMLKPFLKLIWEVSPRLTMANVFLRIVKATIPLLILYIGKLIIDGVIAQIQSPTPDWKVLLPFIFIEFGLAVLSNILNRQINLVDALLGDLFANVTSERLIEKAAQLDLPQFEDANFYDKLERARRQTTNRVTLMSLVLTQMQDSITVVLLITGMVYFEPLLIILLIVSIIPLFIGETYFNQSGYSLVRSWTPERRELDYLRYIGASDETAKEIKIFNLSEHLKRRFKALATKYYDANKRLAIKRSIWGSILNMFGDIAYYGAYVFIIIRTVGGLLSVGDLTFLSGSFNRLRNMLQAWLTRLSKISESALYLQDYFDFMDMKSKIISNPNSINVPDQIEQGFEFRNVSFKYPNSNVYAVKNLSFTLKAGEKLALVGENGAGKTTVVKLLTRLYDPDEGQILLDGKDLKDYNIASLRAAIGVIFQDFVRFYFKAFENVAIGDIDEIDNRAEIVNASKSSLADVVIENLPEKYEQMLGKRFTGGIDLSGGQWQKIALARAYMRDAQLLILDEPTAALDARAEFEAFERFAALTKGKSAVLISHRFSTVRMADRILVLKNGERVEIGSHQELLDRDGLYAELFNIQARGYV